MGFASTRQPSGSNSLCTTSAPPRAVSDGTRISSGNSSSTSSGRFAQRPDNAEVKTARSATARYEPPAYGRSLTYCVNDVAPLRTRSIGSISTSSATVQRSASASG